ncbi:OmpA family protein [Methyloceanibacter caenitepidi]|uniref:OmpA family protein n=1 Tax=Methyloceanibacter caenitepidi TaxID=1384459 RepID=UPI000AA50FBA|nr:OmpA family protein [Methyloceanibacter caenitepidi]
MRKVLGILVLVLGVAALCWYGTKHHAKRIEQTVADGANGAVAASVHGLTTTVTGRDIEVNGLADSAAEQKRILETLDIVQGRRVVRDKIKVLESVAPYTFSAVKSDKGITVSGHVPTEAARAGIAVVLDHDASSLKLASGAPGGWTMVAQDGLSALIKLNKGTLTMKDKSLTLEGEATTPTAGEAALAELKDVPPGYMVDTSLSYLDDGKPIEFELVYSAADGASVSGKLPAGLTTEAIAAALGLDQVSGEPSIAISGDPEPALAILKKLGSWLPEFDSLKLTLGDSGNAALSGGDNGFPFAGNASPGADIELLETGLSKDLGDAVAVRVEAATDLPPDGTSRKNAATGETEVMTAGYWLPQMDFVAGYGQCRDKANALLSKRDVNFVTGSARLDARSLQVINAMTALVMKCVQSGNLRVEVGGHTDSQGDSDFNMDLSQKRADAVVEALKKRGIPGDAITAAGYGDTKPLAENDTEEGRAANRRVTLAFTQ